MKNLTLLACSLILATACGDEGPDYGDRNFRGEMRTLVSRIAARARTARPGFLVIPQNGIELLSEASDAVGPPAAAYLAAIDGVGQEDYRYGYSGDDQPTPAAEHAWLHDYLELGRTNGLRILVTDYCSTPAHVTAAFAGNAADGYLGFVADSRELDRLPLYSPQVFHSHPAQVTSLAAASNFCYLINPAAFADSTALVTALDATEYDIFIVDLFCGNTMLTAAEVAALATKPSGAKRLVICYMSIGEAENYRFYWNPAWNGAKPFWLDAENPDWPGNFKVRYWEEAWQEILIGDGDSYLARILAAGFDGVYLDIIEAFEYFEDQVRSSRKI